MKHSLVFTTLLCITPFVYSMEESQLATSVENLQISQPSAKPWSWFITHLALSAQTKDFSYCISDFDPAVRIFDTDTLRLIVSLQRITVEGKNTDYPSKNVSVKGYTLSKGEEVVGNLICVLDQGKKILSLQTALGQICLQSYKPNGEADLKLSSKAAFNANQPLIRLYPSYIFNPGGPETVKEFFKKLQEEHEAKKSTLTIEQ